MPTYEYACTACGHTFEQFQSFSEDALESCPVCDGRLRKVFNAVGVVFKGSGFYRTDNRATSKSSSATTTSASSSDSSSSSSSSSSDSSKSSSGSSSSASSTGGKSSTSTSSAKD